LRPRELWDDKTPRFSTQSAHRWWWGCQPYSQAALYPPRWFLVLISVIGWVDPRATVWLEGLGQLKNPMTSSGIKLTTFWLVAQCLNQLCHRVPLILKCTAIKTYILSSKRTTEELKVTICWWKYESSIFKCELRCGVAIWRQQLTASQEWC
jgi:hypothetical protein